MSEDSDAEQRLVELSRAAAAGDTTAQCNLGMAYLIAKGIQPDFAKALHWLTKAAEKGDALAEFNLAIMHFRGTGVSASVEMGLKWMIRSAEHHDLDAQEMVGRFLGDKGKDHRAAVPRL